MFEERENAPEVLSTTNIVLAVAVHLLFFTLCWAVVQPLEKKETVIPIDLTVVVHENLDGDENEPPPLEKPKPKPPEPKPKPKPPEPEPKPPEKPLDAVEKVVEKKPKPEKKPPEKPKKPEPPKKTAKQLREERIKRMQEEAKVVKPKTTTNGRTAKKTLSDDEIRKLLNAGYKPGATEQLADNETQRCLSLIYRAFYEKWESPAYSPSLREMVLRVTFDAGGRVTGWTLTQGSGDHAADASVRKAAQQVSYIPGLTAAFLRQNKTVSVRFKVKPQ